MLGGHGYRHYGKRRQHDFYSTHCYERFSIQNGYNRRGDNSTSSTNRGGSTDMLMTVVAMMAVVMGVAVAVVAMVVMVLAVAPIVC